MPSTNPTTPATVKLHRDLYAREAITQAAATFADFASFAVEQQGDHYVVTLSDIDHDVEGDVAAEFCNFSLANSANLAKSGQGD